ncbi:MAG: rhodanese-like domain-containing protein [Methyloprofundus sp.]|nr:rhodanese-like domain-containing protein [Methyloprofundus sp.]
MKKILLIMVLSVQLLACSTTGDGVMQPSVLLTAMQLGKRLVIVDVRSEAEYKAGHVPGAIHIPFWRAFTTDKLMKVDKDEAIIVYCAHGPRAGVAKLAFSWDGFNDLRYLAGHMTAWNSAGLPIAK